MMSCFYKIWKVILEHLNEIKHRKDTRGSSENSNWMSKLSTKCLEKPLCELAIPGSHDSFSYSVKTSSDFAPDQSELVRFFLRLLGPRGKKLLLDWVKCQDLKCVKQLNLGIRYFDMRLAIKSEGLKPPDHDVLEYVYTLHGLYGSKLIDILPNIVTFLENNAHEVILLDLNHFYNFSESDHVELQNRLVGIFGDKICPIQHIRSVTLKRLWEEGRQVLMFYHHTSSSGKFWSGDSIPSPWPNTTEPSVLTKFLVTNMNKKEKHANYFYISQCILTPDIKLVLEHLRSNLKEMCAIPSVQVSSHFLSTVDEDKLNIVILDYAELGNLADRIISINNR